MTDSVRSKPKLEKLSAQCPTHGKVPVVCPRCAGKAGGKAHQGTRWKSRRDLENAGQILDFFLGPQNPE
jgi:hypothetical protein